MEKPLTAQDVQSAYFAFRVNVLARSEHDTPENMIREIEGYEGQAAMQLEEYRHGVELLEEHIVLISPRSVVEGRFDDETLKRIVSPIITVLGGHIGTSEAYRSVALAKR